MKKILLATLFMCAAANLHAQAPAAPKLWVTTYFQMYSSMGQFVDPDSDSRWVFGDNAFGLGAAAHYEVTNTLAIGIDLGYARPAYERAHPETGVNIARGDARVFTALATGRMAYGGAADLGFYLTGGAGTIAYRLDDLGELNADLALRAGTGLEYRWAPDKRVFLEWGRLWGYHEKEGVSGGKATHSILEIGFRGGF